MALEAVSEAICSTLRQMYHTLDRLNQEFLIGGSCGLLLQGVELSAEPRDLDVYMDKHAVVQMHTALQPYALDQPHFSTTEIYKSYLSHYEMHGVQIELVGAFSVQSEGSVYQVEVSRFMTHYSRMVQIQDTRVRTMPLAHELVFNILRKRPDRYLAIAGEMRRDPNVHLPALREILERNVFSEAHRQMIQQLVGKPVLGKEIHHESPN